MVENATNNCDVCVIQLDGDKAQTGEENTDNFKMSFIKSVFLALIQSWSDNRGDNKIEGCYWN